MSSEFPRLAEAIENGVSRRLHTGVQVYISLDEKTVLNAGFGEAVPGRPLQADSVMLWRSSGKPITAAAILKLTEQKHFDLSASLAELLPEADASPLRKTTVLELLTHSSGIPIVDTGWPQAEWSRTLQQILAFDQLNAGVAAYQPQSTWFLLGEIVRRHWNAELSFDECLRELILTPCGMQDVWCGLPNDCMNRLEHRLPNYVERQKGELATSNFSREPWLTAPSPGGNLRGPICQLGRFYEMLLRNGVSESQEPVLHKPTVDAMIRRHRVDQFDETLQHVIDFGLGVIINSNRHGSATVPYGFSRFSSEQSFGHGGAQCSMGFCDPERRLVVAWAANGFCGEGQHQRRNRAINEAIYLDLGLTDAVLS